MNLHLTPEMPDVCLSFVLLFIIFIIVATQKLVLQQFKNVKAKCTENLSPSPCILYLLDSNQKLGYTLIRVYTLQKMDHQVSSQNNLAFSSEYVNMQSSESRYLRNQAHRSKIKHRLGLKTLICFFWVCFAIFLNS